MERDADQATRHALLEQVRRHTGIAMSERKWPLLDGRLRRRLRALALPGYRDYLRRLATEPAEISDFVDLVTTNETAFFRTPRIWDYIADQFLPAWFATHGQTTLRIWSAASSTGEEAYTAAMLCEEFHERHAAFKYHILGTDIAHGVLRHAAAARYCGRNADGLRRSHPALLDKYFSTLADGIEARAALRAHVSFSRHNLYDPPREIGSIDLALLRNVLIYFDASGQQTVLENVRRALRAGGILVVGESESLSRFETGFAFAQPQIYCNPRSQCGRHE